MAKQRRFGVWDELALRMMLTQERRSPRFVPRIGRPRPLFERVRRWRWKLHRRTWYILTRTCIWAGLLICFALAMLPLVLGKAPTSASRYVQLLPFSIFFFTTIACVLNGMGSDPRWIMMRRLRTAMIAHAPTPKTVSELVYRRNVWRADVASNTRAIEAVLCRGNIWVITLTAMPWLYAVADLVLMSLGRSASGSVTPIPAFSGWLEVFFIVGSLAVFAALIKGMNPDAKLVKRSLTENICPECGYPQPEGLVVADERGAAVHFGPEWCSECGTPWPLVPPEPIGTAILGPREEMR